MQNRMSLAPSLRGAISKGINSFALCDEVQLYMQLVTKASSMNGFFFIHTR